MEQLLKLFTALNQGKSEVQLKIGMDGKLILEYKYALSWCLQQNELQ